MTIRRPALALVFTLVLGTVFAAPAAAGDRAFYLTVVDGSVQPGPPTGPAAALTRALLRCNAQESLDACRARIGPNNEELHDGDVQHHPPAASLTAAQHGDAARNARGARRALRAAYANNTEGRDGIIVIDVTATHLTVVVLDWQTGRSFARARRPLRDGGLDARAIESLTRTVMRPIARRFSP